MKKFSILLFVLCLLVCLCSCGEKEQGALVLNGDGTESPAEILEAVEEDVENSAVQEKSEETDALPGIDFTQTAVIFDEGGIKFYADPLCRDEWDEDWIVNFYVENNSDIPIGIDFGVTTINGYEKSRASTMAPIEAGEEYSTEREITSILDELGMDKISTFEFDAEIVNYDTDEVLYDLGHVILRGEAYGTEAPDLVEDEALLLFSDENVQCFLVPELQINTEYNYFNLNTFLKNSCDNLIWPCAENLIVNGVELDRDGTSYVSAGQRSSYRLYESVYFEDFGAESADAIETIEFDYIVDVHHGDNLGSAHIVLQNNAGTLSISSVSPIEEVAE